MDLANENVARIKYPAMGWGGARSQGACLADSRQVTCQPRPEDRVAKLIIGGAILSHE